MNRRITARLFAAALAVGAIGIVGCQSNDTMNEERTTGTATDVGSRTASDRMGRYPSNSPSTNNESVGGEIRGTGSSTDIQRPTDTPAGSGTGVGGSSDRGAPGTPGVGGGGANDGGADIGNDAGTGTGGVDSGAGTDTGAGSGSSGSGSTGGNVGSGGSSGVGGGGAGSGGGQ